MNEHPLVEKLRAYFRQSGKAKAVLGLSGGVDSALVLKLCADALGGANVYAYYLPYFEYPDDARETKAWADALGANYEVYSIKKPVDALCEAAGKWDSVAKGNFMARTRMALLYFHARQHSALVVGTGNKSELKMGYFCYDELTRAFTPKGLKAFNELTAGDSVFSLNLNTNRLEEKAVADIHVFDFDGELLHFDGKRTDLLVTPNHRMLIQTREDTPAEGRLHFIQANECLSRSKFCLPIPNPWSGNVAPPAQFDLSKFSTRRESYNSGNRHLDRMDANDLLYMLGLFIGDGCVYSGRVDANLKTGLSRSEYLESVHRDGVGRFGSAVLSAPVPVRRTYATNEIFFALPTADRARPKLLSILDKYSATYSKTEIVIRLNSKLLFDFFSLCGKGAKNKHVPRSFLDYPAENLAHLFRGLMDSDGSTNGFYTASPQLALDFVELCFKLGKHASIKKRAARQSVYEGKVIRSSESFYIDPVQDIRQTHFYCENIRKVPYTGKVWCPDVPGNHNLLVERNGKFAFCGNTKYGDGGVDVLPLGSLYKTEVWKAARQLGVPNYFIEKAPSAGLWEGQTDEQEMGISYKELDEILQLLESKPNAAVRKFGDEKVKLVLERMRVGEHKLKMPPVL